MTLARKARENVQAGRVLLTERCPNAAASRLYYALFQAGVFRFETVLGLTADRLKRHARSWEHGLVCSNAGLVRGRSLDRRLFEVLRAMRTEADYGSTEIESERVAARLADVAVLVREVTS